MKISLLEEFTENINSLFYKRVWPPSISKQYCRTRVYACRQRAGNPAIFRKGALLLLQKIFAVFFWATQHHVNTLPMSGLFPSLGVPGLQGRTQNLQCQPFLQLGAHCETCTQHAEASTPGISLEESALENQGLKASSSGEGGGVTWHPLINSSLM